MIDFQELIKYKKNNKFYSSKEISFIVQSYLNDEIDDKNMTLWLKEIFEYGMNIDETVLYTESIINSGEKVEFDNLDGYVIDKHSTGGVGDKVSLILGPILVACGCFVPMVVGRHLGHTGGTLDKLESIPGYNGLIDLDKFKKIVKKVGISIIGQTNEICPADRKIYSLRDKTNTIASLPLICGSIMSKKISEGIHGLVLDIKYGNGAFLETKKEGQRLGELLSLIGKNFNVDVKYLGTDMTQPLGNFSGLNCEVIESIYCLRGRGPDDLMDVVFKLGRVACSLAKIDNSKQKMIDVINNGKAYEIFEKMVYEHGGDINSINCDYTDCIEIKAYESGNIKFIDTKKIGDAVNYINKLKGTRDNNSGAEFFKKNNDKISKGDVILRLFSNDLNNLKIGERLVRESYIIK
ncbi:MAG: thymidine phosphorylase [Candidatus Marinimicrobia bacterium]|nr:thymidine phosphorylase [Candidatus Neomarinimicrobiota bacterium]